MIQLLEPKLTSCRDCNWSIACSTDAEKVRREAVHARHAHGITPPVESFPTSGVAWQEAAIEQVRLVASRGERFTFADLGLPDPPNARTAWGRFAQLVHDLGIVHPVGFATSKRAGTKKSAVRVWSSSAAGCDECARKGRS